MVTCRDKECKKAGRWATVFILPFLDEKGRGVRAMADIQVCEDHRSKFHLTRFLTERQWDGIMMWFRSVGYECTRAQVEVEFVPLLDAPAGTTTVGLTDRG